MQIVPNIVVIDSAASRNSVVAMPLSSSELIGTSANDRFIVSKKVPLGGMTVADMTRCLSERMNLIMVQSFSNVNNGNASHGWIEVSLVEVVQTRQTAQTRQNALATAIKQTWYVLGCNVTVNNKSCCADRGIAGGNQISDLGTKALQAALEFNLKTHCKFR